MHYLLSLSILLLTFFVYGQAPEPRSLKALATKLEGNLFQGLLEPGYHFNYKAPNRLRAQKENYFPVLKNPRRVDFRLQTKDLAKSFAELYVCDDAVTYCETLSVSVSTQKPARLVDPSLLGSQALNQNKEANPSGPASFDETVKKNEFGFLEGNLEKILSEAKNQKRLVLFDFSAIWCPGCLRLEQEIFPTKEFKEWTKDYFLVKVDTDRFENQSLAKKYNLLGVPTLLLATPQGEEIQRIYDYQPLHLFQKFFDSGRKNPAPLDELEKSILSNAKPDEEVLNLLADRHYFAGLYQDAIRVWSKVKNPSPFLWDAKIEIAKKSENKSELIKSLEEAVKAEPKSFRSVSWRMDLMKEGTPQAQAYYDEALALIEQFWKDKKVYEKALETTLVGDMTGFENLLLAFVEGDLRSTYLKDIQKKDPASPEIEESWRSSIQKSSSLFERPQPLGPSIRYLNGLIQAKQLAPAEKMLKELIGRFPKETDLQRRLLRVLVLQKKFGEAVSAGEKALKSSYGRNEFWTVEFLAQAYLGNEKKAEARKLLDTALSRTEINSENMKKTRESLQKLRSSLD